MDAELHIKEGRLDEALSSLMSAIRSKPEDPALRVFLFELASLLGQLDRALNQLRVLENMGKETQMLAKVFERVLQGEFLRTQVFAGKTTPLIFGEPEEWVSWLVQACALTVQGRSDEAKVLRIRARDLAPPNPGKVNGKPFQWLMDADSRFGPTLEVIIGGSYYWVPFHRIKRIQCEKPSGLRDVVWFPAQFTWINGGEMAGHVPVRYPGTELSKDGQLKLARCSDWVTQPDGSQFGLGQRLLATDTEDVPLLELRDLEFDLPPQPPQDHA